MSNEDFLIKGAGLQKTFKDFWGRPKVKAIQNIDITVPKGSIFGLLGPNGAGKSTLLKIILGHLYPTAGRIQVLGKDPRDVSIKQKMGYLPERSYLYKNLTATETLHYFGEILGLDKKQIKTRTEQLLEMVGLKNAIHRQVGQFSHGMTRRMGLAQALLNDPELLILDEPTAGLDPVGCREVKDLILTLGQRGKTVLLTSHLLADVEDVADDLLMIFGGTVQSSGKANQLLQDQDKTRLEFPNVSKATLQKTLASLKSELPSASINITSPNQSLEDYFLNLVRTSTAKGDSTSGAAAGSGVAEYLRDEEETQGSGVRSQESGEAIDNDEFSILNETQTDSKEQKAESQIPQENVEKIDLANNSELNIKNSKLEKPGSTEFHSDHKTTQENTGGTPALPAKDKTKKPANCQLPTANSGSSAGATKSHSELNIQNSKLSEPKKQIKNTSAQTKLPPVPKLNLSENEQISIKMKKINKYIHRA
ncbi:ABC transporter ATP-binding protein [Lentisphaera marina]|uniref:ABC transporter ATP-binding protein n=1 Tax=Lentisphaera marina TaxID=1111041 RepID=UPI002365ACCA|nr:ABC transporter ATP-binding protein [Lentisphaera marina]MDD7985754.1 ABC transporter ATP-binding protein [Lentisphaera marina]